MIEQSELIVIVVMAVLFATILVLVGLLGLMLPRLHDSVSRSNLAPLYDALLPLAARTGGAVLEELGDAVVARAGQTQNTVDDELAGRINEQLEHLATIVVALEGRMRSLEAGKVQADDSAAG